MCVDYNWTIKMLVTINNTNKYCPLICYVLQHFSNGCYSSAVLSQFSVSIAYWLSPFMGLYTPNLRNSSKLRIPSTSTNACQLSNLFFLMTPVVMDWLFMASGPLCAKSLVLTWDLWYTSFALYQIFIYFVEVVLHFDGFSSLSIFLLFVLLL